MQLRNKKNGFSFVELVVVIAILAVLLAVLSPMLISSVEHSRMQKDDSAMDEVVNAIQLAITDSETFDEAYDYSIPNNYVTYSDSSGVYGQRIVDEEYWAPDGSGEAVTITFNPDEHGNYDLPQGIVNDMTYGNGSVGEKRTAEGNLKQCRFEEMGNQLLYSAVKQAVGYRLVNTSATYKNSSYTIFIRFYIVDGTRKADVYGAFNGTNLSEGCPAAIGSNTSSHDEDKNPISTTPSGGTQDANYTNSDLTGGGSITNTPSYKRPSNNEEQNSITRNGNIPVEAIYTVKATGEVLRGNDGDSFPNLPAKGDTYEEGDYIYTYNGGGNYGTEWSVKAKDIAKTSYGKILSEIIEKPVTHMYKTFYKCDFFTTAPEIPNSIMDMYSAFEECKSLPFIQTKTQDGQLIFPISL